MKVELEHFLTILGMGCVTYITRAGGLWLMSRVTLSERIEAWLNYITETILVSIIAPTIFSSSIAETIAGLVTILTAVKTKNILVAMLAGVFAVLISREIIR